MVKCQSWLCASAYLPYFTAAAATLQLRQVANGSAITECLSELDVPIYASNTSDYAQAVRPFNLRVPFIPAAYAVPSTVKHVQDAVSCGVKNKIRVTAKSGGHSYGSHGLGGEDGHLILDMRHFNSVTVDQGAHTAVIGTGTRLGNVALALYDQGKQATSHGTCPGVGMGGLTLHGGYGLSSRTHGLTLDNVLEAEVVLADGRVVTASETENSDLFWSLRGAGAAFGIVTNFKVKTWDAPEGNLVFSYQIDPGNTTRLASFLTELQNFTINDQPSELNMRYFMGGQLTGVYYGNRSSYDAVMLPFLQRIGLANWNTTRAGSVRTTSWLDTLSAFSNGALPQPEKYDYHETFFAKSLMPEKLSPAAIMAMSEYYFTVARRGGFRSWYLLIDMHGGKSSAVSKVAADATSYAHRNAVFKMQFNDGVFFGEYPQANFAFNNDWVKAIEDNSDGEEHLMYINYADTSLSPAQAHSRYWGPHYERLVQIKNKYDPGKVFEGPQLVGS